MFTFPQIFFFFFYEAVSGGRRFLIITNHYKRQTAEEGGGGDILCLDVMQHFNLLQFKVSVSASCPMFVSRLIKAAPNKGHALRFKARNLETTWETVYVLARWISNCP